MPELSAAAADSKPKAGFTLKNDIAMKRGTILSVFRIGKILLSGG